MKKILLILIAAQFIIAPQIIKGFGANNSHEYLEVNQKQKTVKKDIFGNTVIEDDKGNKKTIKKDIFGNTIIEWKVFNLPGGRRIRGNSLQRAHP